ncbi:MAG: class I tRNA ligase family protein [Amphiplicatus sp.]
MWSPVEQTALAEAEIEYQDKTSTTIWVKFPVRSYFQKIKGTDGPENALIVTDQIPGKFQNASVVIWTTTPWTIPGNRAICYGPSLSYGLYEVTAMDKVVDPKTGAELAPWTKVGERLVVADKLWDSVKSAARIADAKRIDDCRFGEGTNEIATCWHPLKGFHGGYEFSVPLLDGDHVTDEDGTGFVHTAPSHGQDDYIVYVSAFGTDAEIPHTVDEYGAFTEEAPGFTGKKVLVLEGKKAGQDGDANKAVIDALIERGALLARGRLTHSYPHSWRSKAPVIFRNTPQWFIRLGAQGEGGLRDTALKAIDSTAFTPAAGRNRIRSMVEGRPDWLISRQRAWGVPIAIFVNRDTGEILNDPAVNARIVEAVKARGADAWFDTPAQDFLGKDYSSNAFEKVEDILDVWFDSGSTHAFTLEGRKDLKWPADIYLEGSDQHRGWFQSSLLESCGTRGRAPYDAVLTHGFVLDEAGRKMSKSLGNVVDPQETIREYGADILRIWAASSDYSDDLRIGKEIMGSSVDAYRKLRNTVRYLLGALNGYSDDEALPVSEMPELERYILHLVAELDGGVRSGYEKFDFKGVWRKVFDFCALDLSAFYLDIRKDSLYCDRPDDVRRRAARTVMHILYERIIRWLAPVCVFTMEEAFLARHPGEGKSVHLELFPNKEPWTDEKLAAKWETVREVRRVVTGALELERREKRIGASLEAAPAVYLEADGDILAALKGVDLAEIFISGAVTIKNEHMPEDAFRLPDVPGVGVIPHESEDEKCARCWRYVDDVGSDAAHASLCARCADAVTAHDRKGTAA